MHESFVTMASKAEGGGGGAEDSCGNEQGFDQSFATAVVEKYPGLLYIGKKGHEMKR